ncbi:MAG: DUF2797 domain-containing protein [Prolixibacteraceae bacterium]|nr:DUF2797 domain-containing protein [Prolixibacteraceae bacterium]
MQLKGNILKMRSELADPVRYFLPVGNTEIPMNELIGKEISMKFSGQINCISCGKQTKTSFSQGFCYNCLQTAPEASESVIRPELSKSHFGMARNMEWAEKNDLIDHVVYLALSNEVKVGVTRIHQVPTRWIDQGAASAIQLAITPNRHIAGIIEVFLKKYYTDKTNWRTMLKEEKATEFDLTKEKQKAMQLLPRELQKYAAENNEITTIRYPVTNYPKSIITIGFDKNPEVKGVLYGIKGQYLIFEHGQVLNVRKHNGYFLDISA